MAHAFFSPSASSRWLNCTASQRMIKDLPRPESGAAALEGTFAHHGTEYILLNPRQPAARDLAEDPVFLAKVEDSMGFDVPVSEWLADDDLLDAIDSAVEYNRRIPGIKRLEWRLSLEYLIPDTFGTADLVSVHLDNGKRVVHIGDNKFGRDPVRAFENEQLGIYALSAIHILGGKFDEVWLHIIQPRIGNYDQWLATPEWLSALESRVRASYDAYLNDCGVFVPSEKTCKWCPAAGTCSAYMKFVKDQVCMEFDPLDWPVKSATHLDADQIAKHVLPNLDAVEAWVSKVRAHALTLAVSGEALPGYKLVSSVTKRRWSDETAATEVLLQIAGNKPDKVFTRKLISIGAAEKLVGKANKEVLSPFIEKPQGRPVLVSEQDKRPAINPKEASLAEFDFNLTEE